MRIRLTPLLAGLMVLVTGSACSDATGFEPTDPDLFVVQAYLFAGQPVRDVRVTGVLPIDTDDQADALPITDALVTLTRGEERFDLTPTHDDPGAYHDPTGAIVAAPGDVFGLEVRVGERIATASTIVPPPPAGLSLSSPEFISIDLTLGGRQALQQNLMLVRWESDGEALHFVTIESAEAGQSLLPSAELFEGLGVRFVAEPTAADSAFVSQLALKYFGLHKLTLHRVNQEYADLYAGLVQDSRDLNEPPSNIENGLGIFSAFSSDSVFFNVR